MSTPIPTAAPTVTAPATTPQAGDHPCFDEAARARSARVHLPVAPRCNIACNYCDHRSDCVSESRPGLSSTVLTPEQAADYVDRLTVELPQLSVVGIAGPGDPMANAEKTLRTLQLVRERHPELLLCLSSNGLALPPHLDDLADLGLSHVTLTINTVDPEVGAQVYRWVRDGREVHRGVDGAALLLERQLASLRGLVERGMTVKVNTVLVPGVTDAGVGEVARTVAELGAAMMNCVPLYPVAGTPFGQLPTPPPDVLARARREAGAHVRQMTHCQRCRADAVGLLGEDLPQDAVGRLMASRAPSPARSRIAVASQEGFLVNQHLGGATQLMIFEEGPSGPRLVEHRQTPPSGGGAGRWAALAGVLRDCRAVLVHQVGSSPRMVLESAGIAVHETDGLVREAVGDLLAGRPLRSALPARSCTECEGPGTGCG